MHVLPPYPVRSPGAAFNGYKTAIQKTSWAFVQASARLQLLLSWSCVFSPRYNPIFLTLYNILLQFLQGWHDFHNLSVTQSLKAICNMQYAHFSILTYMSSSKITKGVISAANLLSSLIFSISFSAFEHTIPGLKNCCRLHIALEHARLPINWW